MGKRSEYTPNSKIKMEGTLKADKHYVTFAFDPKLMTVIDDNRLLPWKYSKEIGYVWTIYFEEEVSYLVDIMPMDEARCMYE